MIVGIPRETFPGERRVALIPRSLPALTKTGHEVAIESGAGNEAGYPDAEYEEKGAKVLADRTEVFKSADVIFQVRGLGANPQGSGRDLELMREGQTLIGMVEPLAEPKHVEAAGRRGLSTYAMELIPRITRAQSMDALSSMATVAGYKAVLMAAEASPKLFPMLMTAAGTLAPSRVFIIGAGVAGLVAISTARRLGAVVEAYDVRPAVKEQVESLGASFLELELDTGAAETKGGYAKAQDESFLDRQRELMLKAVADCDVIITTAAIPGKKAPILVTEEMVRAMKPGSVIVDLAAERGGNCELTKPDESVKANGVTILGPTNLASTAPFHASQMFAKNISTLFLHLAEEDRMGPETEDEIAKATLLTRDGEVVHPDVRAKLGAAEATE